MAKLYSLYSAKCSLYDYCRIFESNMASDINCSTKTRNILRLVKRNITSAVFAEMSIELKGNTSFFNNIGGGITIVEKRIDVHDNVEFINNCSPYDGGGISLEDESFVSGIYLVTFYASLFQAKFAIYIYVCT